MEPRSRFMWPGVVRGYIASVQVQHVSYWDCSGMTVAFCNRPFRVFGREESRERSFSPCNVVCNAARGFIVAGVADNPYGSTDGSCGIFPLRSEPQSGAFASSRHNSLILSI